MDPSSLRLASPRSIVRLSKGGQITLPASIRHRWGTTRFLLKDRGDEISLEPLAEDPISAFKGAFAGPGASTTEAIKVFREDERIAEERKYKR